jgi:membrane-bound ClpP family serine protease
MQINLPLENQSADRAKQFVTKAFEQARASGVQPLLVFEFLVPPEKKEYGRGTRFEDALKLARFLAGDQLRGGEDLKLATTVAYVPQSVQGHAVLPILACDRIVIAPEAELGPAGVDETVITPTILAGYKEIASRRKAVPEAVALKLVDLSKDLIKADTDVGDVYLASDALAELKRRRTVGSTKVLIRAEQPGRFSGRELRQMGFASHLAANRNELAASLDLPPEALVEDPLLSGELRAVRIDLKGPITASKVSEIERMIEDARKKDRVNFVCLWIESAGGSLTDSIRLANDLVALDPREVYTVAYVPTRALADAALVAMACNQVVLRRRATLGGEGDYVYSSEEALKAQDTVKSEIAPRRSRTWSLWMAMIDPNLEVFRYTREGGAGEDTYYLCSDEFRTMSQNQPDGIRWREGEAVTRRGRPFSADAVQAREYRLANHVVDSFDDFRRLYSIEDDPALMEPGWADFLVSALASPGVAFLLLIIGGAALYTEMHAPGIGIGAFVSAVCFALFFWSRFLGGTAGWLAVVLFLAGIAFLLIEVFVLPGFGIFGLGGGALVLASLVLAGQTFVIPHNAYQFAEMERSLLVVGLAAVGIITCGAVINHFFPRTPLLGRMVLEPPTEQEAEDISRREVFVDFTRLTGMRGTTTTQLLPSGKALIANQLIDVMTDGEFVGRGARVEVIEVHGNRILVREVD